MHEKDKTLVYSLLEKINLKPYEIIEIKPIHHGFTNLSFYVKTVNQKEYQVRIGKNNEIVNREIEAIIVEKIFKDDFLYYDKKTGNAIKKWFQGRDLKRCDLDEAVLKTLIKKIETLHETDLSDLKILPHDAYQFLEKDVLEEKHYLTYLNLLDEVKDKTLVFSHNDLNLKNILINEEKDLMFIDFE